MNRRSTAGASLQISLNYVAEALGVHSLPLQLQIQNGRRLRLDLVATCVEDGVQQAYLPGASLPGLDGHLTLQPVQVADAKPPLQMFAIQNTGPAEMDWKLDLSPLAQLQHDNWGCVTACIAELSNLKLLPTGTRPAQQRQQIAKVQA
jgi:hypothetical protein